MKIVMVVLIVTLGVFALALIVAAFSKKVMNLEREVLINKPLAEVFDYLFLLKNQDNFSKWAQVDLNMIKEYHGIDGTVGFVSAWESKNKNVGKGEQEIIKISENKRIDYELRFLKPFKATNFASFVVENIANRQSKVKWNFNGKMKYPMNLILLFGMEKGLANDLDTGLKSLKAILEKEN